MSVGKVIVTKRGSFQERRHHEWAQHVGYAGRQVRPERPLTGPLTLTVLFYVPKPKSARKADYWPIRRPDLDNLLHKLTDQWNGIFWEDDAQIVRLFSEKGYATEETVSGVDITIESVR